MMSILQLKSLEGIERQPSLESVSLPLKWTFQRDVAVFRDM